MFYEVHFALGLFEHIIFYISCSIEGLYVESLGKDHFLFRPFSFFDLKRGVLHLNYLNLLKHNN